MRKTVAGVILPILLLLLLIPCCLANETSVTLNQMGFAFTLPAPLQEMKLNAEMRKEGAVYAAQSEDEALRFFFLVKPVRRAGDVSASALVKRRQAEAGVIVDKPVVVNGCEFIVSEETVSNGAQTVTFRMATAVLDGRQLAFFFIDQLGAYEEIPRQLIDSFVSLPNPRHPNKGGFMK